MQNWNAESLDQQFRQSFEREERYLRRLERGRANRSALYDATLAKYEVYSNLCGAAALESREALLDELQRMKAHENQSKDAGDPERFERYRRILIERLISKFVAA